MGKFVDLSGKTFNSWTVLSRDPVPRGNTINWICKCSCGSVKSVTGTNLTRDKSKSCGKCYQVICDFGVNDLGRNVTDDSIYLTWKRMVERCYSQNKYKSYQDKFVCDEWKTASSFEQWMLKQNWENMELDKDLLVLGNTEYGPDTCWFVPKKINLLLGISGIKRGEYPIGVTYHNDGLNKFMARTGTNYLGLFKTPIQAHKAWQTEKAEDILKSVDWWQFSPEVNHTFNQRIAINLLKIRDKLIIQNAMGLETTKFV